jgi:hypothetical protein
VVSAGYNEAEPEKFFVSSIRGEGPELIFSRNYDARVHLWGSIFVQSDDQGQVYVVLFVRESMRILVCLDGKTGDPVGSVELPGSADPMVGTPFREYAVVGTGGLVYQQQISNQGSNYTWYDCH